MLLLGAGEITGQYSP